MSESLVLGSDKCRSPSLASCVIADLKRLAMRSGDTSNPSQWNVVVFRMDPFGFSGASRKELHATSRSRLAAMRQRMMNACGLLDEILEHAQKQIVAQVSPTAVIDEFRSVITSQVAIWATLAEGVAISEVLSECESHGDNSWTSAIREGAGGLFVVFTWKE